MYHKLSQLLQDKSRRTNLAKSRFRLEDTSGDFAVLDFENKSIRVNHRAAFDQIFRLGGEKLLEKLLAEGNTCLTDDPNAAKSGVYPIAGTERFFLKTNVGDPAALASILFGIAGWGEICDGWDEDDIIIEDDSEEDSDEPDETDGPEDLDEMDSDDIFEAPEARSYDMITKNGKTSFFDPKNREYLHIFDAEGNKVEEIFNVEEIFFRDEVFGYRYQLEEDGKWGYISRTFTQVLPPRFDGIIAADGAFWPMIFAWTLDSDPFGKEEEPVLYVHYSGRVALRGDNSFDDWLPVPFGKHGGIIGCVDRCYLPTSSAYVDEETTSTGDLVRMYCPDKNAESAYLSRCRDDGIVSENWCVTYSKGFLTLKDSYGSVLSVPAADLRLSACIRLLEADAPSVEAIECLKLIEGDWPFAETGLYIVRKDALYAVAELELKTGAVKRLLTPFAFTAIEKLMEDYVVVDLFGKKGVFCCSRQKYIVPCDYETVRVMNDGRPQVHFAVTRMGFSGEINLDGKWSEHLHR